MSSSFSFVECFKCGKPNKIIAQDLWLVQKREFQLFSRTMNDSYSQGRGLKEGNYINIIVNCAKVYKDAGYDNGHWRVFPFLVLEE